MLKRSAISLMALLLPGAAISGGHVCSLRPFVSYVEYPDALRMRPSAAIGGAIEFHAGPRSTLHLSYSSASSSTQAETIGGAQTVPITVERLHAGFLYRLAQFTPWLGAGASLSGGVARFATPDRAVPLGALGTAKVEGAADVRASVAASVPLEVRPGGPVSFVIEPGAAAVAPLSMDHVSYFIAGGIRIGLF